MSKTLPGHDQETIITFNNEEEVAYIFTYDRIWQRHLEKVMGLTPVMNNGSGGKEYQLDKKLIPMPRVKRKSSGSIRKKKSRNLPERPVLRSANLSQIGKFNHQGGNGGKSISPIKKEVARALLGH